MENKDECLSIPGVEEDGIVLKRVGLKPITIERMKRFYPLFVDIPTDGVKEVDIIAFMVERSFDFFISSGEVEKRIGQITGKV